MNRRTALIFYILSIYVVIQFVWWGIQLFDLNNQIYSESEEVRQRFTMIVGEGAVFLLLLVVGIWQIHRSIRKDLNLSKRQKNFLLSVTHELKTPLAANKLYIQTVTKRNLSKEQSDELLQKAIDENTRLEQMIDNILNASRLENRALNPVMEDFDATLLFQQIQTRFTAISSGESAITLEIEEGMQMHSDRIMVESIVGNLVENALKYAGRDKPITIYAYSKDGQVVFGVKDQGPGIPKEQKADIFKKFYRAQNEETRSQKGTGLGLFIVSRLVFLQNGTVQCLDNDPQGADFQITL
ncbi:ATP-binding protein [Crocinitomicaceae bacterium]|nr:ATP-binding protein [Crocinitomicaceae bacterium]MDB3906783.1 ATP-binding protein [Crocinitomicaceae bacterium]